MESIWSKYKGLIIAAAVLLAVGLIILGCYSYINNIRNEGNDWNLASLVHSMWPTRYISLGSSAVFMRGSALRLRKRTLLTEFFWTASKGDTIKKVLVLGNRSLMLLPNNILILINWLLIGAKFRTILQVSGPGMSTFKLNLLIC